MALKEQVKPLCDKDSATVTHVPGKGATKGAQKMTGDAPMLPWSLPPLSCSPWAFCPHVLHMIPLTAQDHSFGLGAQAWQSAAGHGHETAML